MVYYLKILFIVLKNLQGDILRIEEINQNHQQYLNQIGTVAGWAKTVRSQNNIVFIELSDGSSIQNLQIVCDQNISNYQEIQQSGAQFSFKAKGLFVKSQGNKQNIEMIIQNDINHYIKILGKCDQKQYPLAKKRHKLETLREFSHLRSRTNIISSIMRVRNNVIFGSHSFFQNKGFLNISTPIITSSDCEGAGDMFKVTTLDLENKNLSFDKDFFKKPCYLTVSGQLSIENYACSMSNVYTLGPTFRAENSNTSRHLAEFWMLEPEVAFADIFDIMNLAEEYLKFIFDYCLQRSNQDLQFFNDFVKKDLIDYLKNILQSDFKKIEYKAAIQILQKDIQEKKTQFQNNDIIFGVDLQSEHERYLTEQVYKCPIFLYNFPKEIKSFYMKENEDERTVAAFDVLVPNIGELIGGSQREDSYSKLENRIKQSNLNIKDYQWYLDLRQYGTVPHSGFGVGIERLVMLLTGTENIKDVIPFPRYPGHSQF